MAATAEVLQLVRLERQRQFARYGSNEDLEDGTGPDVRWLGPFTGAPAVVIEAELRRDYEDYQEETGNPTWVHLIREEVAEAFTETDPDLLVEELIQVAALCVSWVEKIQARCPARHPETDNPCVIQGPHQNHRAMGTQRMQLFGDNLQEKEPS
jgi:hypothetical protein